MKMGKRKSTRKYKGGKKKKKGRKTTGKHKGVHNSTMGRGGLCDPCNEKRKHALRGRKGRREDLGVWAKLQHKREKSVEDRRECCLKNQKEVNPHKNGECLNSNARVDSKGKGKNGKQNEGWAFSRTSLIFKRGETAQYPWGDETGLT